MDIITDILNNIPISAVLKKKIIDLGEEMSVLKSENLILKTENQRFKLTIEQQNKKAQSYEKHPHDSSLNEHEKKILSFISKQEENSHLTTEDISQFLNIGLQATELYLKELVAKKILRRYSSANYDIFTGPRPKPYWKLIQKTQPSLIQKELIIKENPVILVVDDHPQDIELLEAYLVPQGYEIVSAANGEEALKKFSGNQIDLILLDVMMPGMDGFEVCQKLKANPNTAPIPVLLLTSLHNRESRLSGMMAGANDFITKPIDKEDLRLRVKNAIYSKRLYDEMQSNYEKLKELEKLRDNSKEIKNEK